LLAGCHDAAMIHLTFPKWTTAGVLPHLLLLFSFADRGPVVAADAGSAAERRFLYVATPGIRNYLEYGGHGVIVFDIDAGYRLVKRT
jgi:hypothetical protein